MFETTTSQARILDATRQLVRRGGYAVVSLRQIAAAAGYSPAGLYAHFPGREAILDALADSVRVELGAALEAAAAQAAGGDAVEQLVSLGQAYIGFAVEHPAEFELLFRYTRSHRQSWNDATPSSLDLVRGIVGGAARETSGEEDNVASLALWATVHGLANLRLFHLAEFDGDWDDWSRQILRRHAEAVLCRAP